MTPSPYSEDALVQRTTAEYLEQQLGWESLYAYNNEDFGSDSLLGRGSDREGVLTRALRVKLAELNPGLPEEAYDDAGRRIFTTTATQSLFATNREKYGIIREGVQVAFRNDKGERERRRLRVFDFSEPGNNSFLCVRELWVRGDLYRRRADIVGFVNGLPLLFVELKNVHRDLSVAYENNYRDYLDTGGHPFHFNAAVILGNGIEGKIGTLGSPYKFFHEWRRLAEDEPGAVDMETLLKGVCNKRNFLDLLENFILFDDSAGRPKKILARNHQFLGVNRAVEAVRDRKGRDGRVGVFWHTQGAGKSYSMVRFTRKVHRRLGGNFTFLVMTDREDLDTQIYKTFAGCGVVDNDHDPCRAASGEHLSRLLGQHKSHIFSLIQKFNRDVEPDQPYTERDDLIVITDEAHRTQYGTLALNMRNALPNADYIGFTGTPLFKDDEITRRVFGEYVSTYDFQRAVEDRATVPLYYDARGDKLGVSVGDLNDRIAEKLEELETEDIDVEQRLEQELKRDYHILTAGRHLDQIASDFVQHFSTTWETVKAMVVCIDKITCVRIFRLIEFYWDQRIRELERALSEAADEQDEQIRLRREFERSPAKRTTVQNLKAAIEQRLQRLLRQNPLRTDFQRRYEEIVADYNSEKDRVTIEKTFADLMRFVDEMSEEESRAVREGLDEESLAVFDLLKKPDLSTKEIRRTKAVAVDLLQTLKAEKLRIDHWRDKEATRDAVRLAIRDFLWSEATGLPVNRYSEGDVQTRADEVYRHVYRVYPTLPSPYFGASAGA